MDWKGSKRKKKAREKGRHGRGPIENNKKPKFNATLSKMFLLPCFIGLFAASACALIPLTTDENYWKKAKTWNTYCGLTLASMETAKMVVADAGQYSPYLNIVRQKFNEIGVKTGNPVDAFEMYQDDLKKWVQAKGVLPSCQHHCQGESDESCIEYMSRILEQRRAFLIGAASEERKALVFHFYDSDTDIMLGILDALEMHRTTELAYLESWFSHHSDNRNQ